MCGLFRDPLSFSQTCYVSAGLMQACPGGLSRISISLLSAPQQFLKFSVSGSDSRRADEHPLPTFDSENIFNSQFREVVAERRTGWGSEGSKIKGKCKGVGGGRKRSR